MIEAASAVLGWVMIKGTDSEKTLTVTTPGVAEGATASV
jgi:hypothetical protein